MFDKGASEDTDVIRGKQVQDHQGIDSVDNEEDSNVKIGWSGNEINPDDLTELGVSGAPITTPKVRPALDTEVSIFENYEHLLYF